jgi:predicted amino acid-binding ACT domain protein
VAVFVWQGLRLELCTNDRVGLLSDVTRIFREHGLSVTRAGVSTRETKACNVFYVKDASGRAVDAKVLESVRREIGQTILKVSEVPVAVEARDSPRPRFSLGNLLGMPSQVLHSLGLIKSYS